MQHSCRRLAAMASLLGLTAVAGCEADAAPQAPGGGYDAAEMDVRVVRDPRSCAVSRMSLGRAHSCAVLVDGRVFCWGANDVAQLGLTDVQPRTTPVFVPTPAPAVEISAGSTATCARLADASVACWGQALGVPDGKPLITTPTVVPLPGNATNVVTGGAHACALLSDGGVQCWGGAGLVGDGSAIDRAAPVAVEGVPDKVSGLFASSRHTCALTTKGEAWCWGYNETGALGLTPGNAPRLAPLAAKVVEHPLAVMSLAPERSCAVVAGDPFGQLACWPPLEAPLLPAWGEDFRALGTGSQHLCAIRADLSLRCAGTNDEGQVGPDPRLEVPLTEPIEVFDDAISVRAGAAHTCALRADRSLWCWGRNTDGQLGIGSTANTNQPTPVAFPPGCPAS